MNRAVIFDVDGVLVDSYGAHFESWVALARETGTEMTEQQFRSNFGRTTREIIAETWPEASLLDEGQLHSLDLRKEALYRKILRREFPVMDGAVELIDALQNVGYLLALGSSGPPENVAAALDGLDRTNAINAVVTGEDVRCGKPDPQVFLVAAQRLGVGPEACAVVEDAPAGVTAANRAGMVSIGLVGTVSQEDLSDATMVVKSLTELSPHVIGGLLE